MRLLLSLSIAAIAFTATAQSTSSGLSPSELMDMRKTCIKTFSAEKSTSFIDPAKACDCLLGHIAGIVIDSADRAATGGEELFTQIFGEDPSTNSEFVDCISGSLRSDVPISKFGNDFVQTLIDGCTVEMQGNAELQKANVDPAGTCSCIFEEARRKGLTLNDINALQDQSSVHFNEILLPCVQKNIATGTTSTSGGRQLGSPDVTGKNNNEHLLMVKLGGSFKVKMRMGGLERYFILDSGASDCLIPASLEKELLAKQAVRKDGYLDEQEYKLADGRIVKCRRFMLNSVGLGGFTIRNVIVGVIDEEAQPLLGKSLLDKFEQWSVDPQTAMLHLKRQ